MAYTYGSTPTYVYGEAFQGGMVPGQSLGGAQSPGHMTRNAYYQQPDPGNSYRDANGRIVYGSPKGSSGGGGGSQTDPYYDLMNKALDTFKPPEDNTPEFRNQLMAEMAKWMGGQGMVGGSMPLQGGTSRETGSNRGGTPFNTGTHDQVGGYIGGHQQQPIQQYLPHWVTNQSIHDIHAKGAARGAPSRHLSRLAGARGIDAGSPMFAASAVKNHAMKSAEAARYGADTDFQDHLERSKFDIRHALAQNQDVIQGAQNQAMRDAMMNQGQNQNFNQILSILGQFV